MRNVRGWIFALSLVACAVPDELENVEQESVGDPRFRWTGNPPVVPVCWVEPTNLDVQLLDGSPSVSEATLRVWVRDLVEGQWSRYARLNFTGWNACTPSDPFGIRLRIDGSGGGGAGYGTNDPQGTIGIRFDTSPSCRANRDALYRCVGWLTLHELGHLVGYHHQEQHPNYVQTDPQSACLPHPYRQPEVLGAYDLQSVMSYCGQTNVSNFKTAISAGDTAGHQTSYGRRAPGQLVAARGADLLSTTSPGYGVAGTFLWDDDASSQRAQSWQYDWATQMLSADDWQWRCLDAYPSTYPGSPVVTYGCVNDDYQHFRFADVALRGWGGLCLESYTKWIYTYARMATCNDSPSQRWEIDPFQRIRLAGTDRCLTAGRVNGGSLYLATCGAVADVQNFDMLPDGSLGLGGDQCVEVLGPTTAAYRTGLGLPAPGARVQTAACISDQLNQKWNLSGRLTHASGLCLDHGDANTNGSAITLGTCGATSQRWDYYWK